MISVKRLGHATLTTPDIDRQIAYYTEVVGLTLVERTKDRAFLACKMGLEAIALEPGTGNALSRLAFQVAPETDLDDVAQNAGERWREGRARDRHFARHRRGRGVHRSEGHQDRDFFRLRIRQGRRSHRGHHAAQTRPRRLSGRRRAEDRKVLLRRARLPRLGLARRQRSPSCAAIPTTTPSISFTTPSRSSTTSPSR